MGSPVVCSCSQCGHMQWYLACKVVLHMTFIWMWGLEIPKAIKKSSYCHASWVQLPLKQQPYCNTSRFQNPYAQLSYCHASTFQSTPTSIFNCIISPNTLHSYIKVSVSQKKKFNPNLCVCLCQWWDHQQFN